ncbi:MAG TPA: carbohydrate-binding protein [Cellvibrio sp.]|nr:carbohydrate-binding protein [Cellvibrio sp.]
MKKTKIFFTGLLISVAAVALPISSTLAASQYMDFFKPTPIVGSLSTTAWGASVVGPRDQSNGLEDKTLTNYVYWDGGIIKAPDGTYHMFGSRWNQVDGHYAWGSSVAIHATSSNLYGPYIDQGMLWPNDHDGKGHNVFPLQLKDGRYGIVASETLPGTMYIADNLNGPWVKAGNMQIASGPYADKFTMSNVSIMLRPDGKYEAIQRNGVIAIADSFVGPYVVQGSGPLWNQISGMETTNIEDPVIWYSGGLYHVIANQWNAGKAFHLTSVDGIKNWKLQPGYAYYPTADFIRYTNSTVNHYTKLERPSVYKENGHVVAMTFSALDVEKWQDGGNDKHGSKIIVVPFDGEGLDSTTSRSAAVAATSSSTVSTASSSVVSAIPASGSSSGGSKGGGSVSIWELLCLGALFCALRTRRLASNN